jgi:hypothetical protein
LTNSSSAPDLAAIAFDALVGGGVERRKIAGFARRTDRVLPNGVCLQPPLKSWPSLVCDGHSLANYAAAQPHSATDHWA